MISLRKCQKLMIMTTVLTIIRMTWILPFTIVSEMQLSVGLRKWRIQNWNSSSNFLQIWNHQKSLLSIRNILNSMQKYLRVHLATENSPTVLFVEIFNFLYSSLNKWAAIENTHSIAKKMVNSTYIPRSRYSYLAVGALAHLLSLTLTFTEFDLLITIFVTYRWPAEWLCCFLRLSSTKYLRNRIRFDSEQKLLVLHLLLSDHHLLKP